MKVSVLVIAYNHARFIRQALDSVLAQQTDFDFEILINEDCSTDGTREIVLQYARADSDRIHLLLSDSNTCSPLMGVRGIAAARGDFIAFLDGDDYWTSPHKLQKQVQFMEAHPEYVLSWHDVEFVDVEGRRMPEQKEHISQVTWSLRDIFERPFSVETGSVLLRRESLPSIPAWYKDSPAADYPLLVITLQRGLAGYLDEMLGAYRIHSESFGMKGRDEIGKLVFWLRTYRHVFIHMDAKHRAMMVGPLAKFWLAVAIRQKLAGDHRSCRRTAQQGLIDCPHDFKLLLLAYAPWAWVPARTCFRFSCWLFGTSPKAAGE